MNTGDRPTPGIERQRRNPGTPPPMPPKDGDRPPVAPAAVEKVPSSALQYQLKLTRLLLLTVAYSGVIVFAHWLAFLIRFEFVLTPIAQDVLWRSLAWSLPLELAALSAFGQFRSALTYFSLPDARRIILAFMSSSIVTGIIWYATKGHNSPPRSIVLLSFLLCTFGLITLRVAFRMLRDWQRSQGTSRAPRRVVIIGAGDVGANLAKEMALRHDLGMHPVAFFDDDKTKWNTYIHGVPVIGRPELLAKNRMVVDEAVITMPSASGKRLREVVQVLNERHIRSETVPSIEQMVNGAVQVSQIRPVEIEDLLGREPVVIETGRIRELVGNKVVMVTGAGGSIGSELCRQIVGYNPLRLLLVERCEVQIFPIEQELLGLGCGAQIIPLVADILDGERMRGIFERFRPQLVFHAAAHKHVPMMEHQPYEAFRNNTIGTKQLAKLSVEFGVERFVLISTDKAINPTNVMGATKRLAELYVQALQEDIRKGRQETGGKAGNRETGRAETAESGNGTGLPWDGRSQSVLAEPAVSAQLKLMAVRFGNVLGSSGSVVPTFKRQIEAGGPVTVTHPDITRYFMTIPEAVGLVLQSATQGREGRYSSSIWDNP